jgi:glycosyltransferase involved in cell wall biosynthesis
LNQSEIVAKGYADLDALVLPSGEYETWGLVVNEAMTGGIPAIVSDMVGCAPDLVQEDRTGYVFRSGDVAGLTRSIDRLVARLESGHDFAPAVHERIALYSIARTVSGVEQALRAAAA